MAKLAQAELPAFEDVNLDGPNVKSRTFGDTPLHIIAIWGDTDSAEILIHEGAEVDARGEDDCTPLHNAVEQDKPEMVRLLLTFGANPDLQEARGLDAYQLAEILGHTGILEILNQRKRA